MGKNQVFAKAMIKWHIGMRIYNEQLSKCCLDSITKVKLQRENYVSYHEGKRMDLKTGHPTLGAFIVDKKGRSELVYSERLFLSIIID